MSDIIVTIYIKDGCHLCDKMLLELASIQKDSQGLGRFSVQTRDIEDRQDWNKLYREYVPVLVVNGKEVCHYFLDQQEFEQALLCH